MARSRSLAKAKEINMENKFTLNDVLESTVFEITKYGTVLYLGYGYETDDDDNGKNYRFIDYSGIEVPIAEVNEVGFCEVENTYAEFAKQYITDCTAEECLNIYSEYNGGESPIVIDEFDKDLVTGVYVIRRKD